MTIQAVTFDFWNTLAYERAGYLMGLRADAWERLLRDAGFERARIEAALGEAWGMLASAWVAGDDFHTPDAAGKAVELLGPDVPPDLRAVLIEAFMGAADGAELHIADGVRDALRALKESGMRLGIICDVGFTPSPALRRILDRAGLLAYFDRHSFSDEVRAYKPSREIFEHALGGLGVAPEHAAHVGDLRRTDVAGALAMGMTAVRYTGVFDDTGDGPEAHHVIAHHRQLPTALGIA